MLHAACLCCAIKCVYINELILQRPEGKQHAPCTMLPAILGLGVFRLRQWLWSENGNGNGNLAHGTLHRTAHELHRHTSLHSHLHTQCAICAMPHSACHIRNLGTQDLSCQLPFCILFLVGGCSCKVAVAAAGIPAAEMRRSKGECQDGGYSPAAS